MEKQITVTVKDLIKYFLFLLVLGGSIASVTWTVSSRPDRSEVKEMIKDTLEPIQHQLTRIERQIDNISKQKESSQ